MMKFGIALLLLLSSSSWAASFTYTDLVNLIQQNKIMSVEALLPLLPEDLRSNYTLMFASGSLQGATFNNPRAIMFGTDASLTCAFNGDKSEKGFNHFECFQFQKDTQSFDFRQIEFPSPSAKIRKVVFSRSGMSSDGNTSCLSCHSSDPRPNWDGYSLWKGSYGANDDDITDYESQYASFVKTRPTHPRYKWLIQGTDPKAPYSSFDIKDRPNLRFSDLVGKMNARRTARILGSAVPDWQSLAFAMGVFNCSLSSDEQTQISQSGLPFVADTDPLAIFQKLNITPNDWSTEIDPSANPSPIYDHQSGFGYLKIDTAMAIISKKADAGDVVFKNGMAQLIADITAEQTGTYIDFYQVLFGILPDPDFFGPKFQTQEGYFCGELTRIFTEEYLGQE
jgi:hypothetical protein